MQNIPDPKCTVPDEHLEFIVDLSERAFKQSLDDRDSVQKKVYYLLGVITAVIILSVNVLIRGNIEEWAKFFLWSEILNLGSVAAVLLFLLRPKNYFGDGVQPIDLLKKPYLKIDLKKVKLRYLDDLQGWIEDIMHANRQLWKQTVQLMWTLLISFPIYFLVLFLFGRLPAGSE
ncbi:MAG: hypothetical protein KDN22_10980 [Verrucomicrobiae bacterium]|nr:hypothetical protein [Verrucomicrobiae bacterium]